MPSLHHLTRESQKPRCGIKKVLIGQGPIEQGGSCTTEQATHRTAAWRADGGGGKHACSNKRPNPWNGDYPDATRRPSPP
jgi:hypothetical protein